jgi:hypothetical protein
MSLLDIFLSSYVYVLICDSFVPLWSIYWELNVVTLYFRFDTALEVGRLLAMKKYFVISVCVGILFFINYIGYALAFWYGVQLNSRSEITPGRVFTVSFLCTTYLFINGYTLMNKLVFIPLH